MKLIFLIITSFIFLAGCSSTSPLTKSIKSYEYIAFNPARSEDGAGTIISFHNNAESLVARSDQCLFVGGSNSKRRDAKLASESYILNSKMGLEFSLIKAIDKDIDLEAAIGTAGIEKVKIEFIDPFEETISKFDVDNYLRTLSEDSICKPYFNDSNNFVISQALGVKGLRYTYLDKNEKQVSLTAQILSQVNIDPALRSDFEGGKTLNFNQEILIGYRAWIVNKSSGLIGDNYVLNELKPKDLKSIRDKSKK